jgi:hypothetical protein
MRTLIAAFAACAAATAGCKKEAPPAEPSAVEEAPRAEPTQNVAAAEPTTDWKSAQALPARAAVTGSFAPAKAKAADDDWYRV